MEISEIESLLLNVSLSPGNIFKILLSFAETDPVNFGNAGSHILTIYSVTA